MQRAPKYKVTLDELERDARVTADEQVETVDSGAEPAPDPRGPQPDRDWRAAGG